MKSYISRKLPLETRTTAQIFDLRSPVDIPGLMKMVSKIDVLTMACIVSTSSSQVQSSLEGELQREFDLSRRSHRAGDLSGGCNRCLRSVGQRSREYCGVWLTEIGMIQQVEELSTEQQAASFAKES